MLGYYRILQQKLDITISISFKNWHDNHSNVYSLYLTLNNSKCEKVFNVQFVNYITVYSLTGNCFYNIYNSIKGFRLRLSLDIITVAILTSWHFNSWGSHIVSDRYFWKSLCNKFIWLLWLLYNYYYCIVVWSPFLFWC